MKISYTFNNGERSEVEVSEELGTTIKKWDRIEDNADRKERYHCLSLDGKKYEGPEYGYDDENINDILEDHPLSDIERLRIAITKLKPSHRAVIKAIYFDEMTREEYAQIMGVSHQAISKQLKAAEKNLKKYF